MASIQLRSCLILATLVALPLAMSTARITMAKDDAPDPSVELGEELFKRDWSQHKSAHGDGLGPMFNAVSCVECHEMGGVGGAGKVKHNVDLLSLVSPRPKGSVASPALVKRLRKIHPDLNATTLSVTLHKAGFRRLQDEPLRDPRYDQFRTKFRDDEQGASQATHTLVQRFNRGRMVFEMSQRSTPALFGAGIIDQIPDQALIKLAQHQQENVPGISGRIPQTPTGAVGRFGWRGQIGSLHEFVLGACVNELGLQVSNHRPEPENPVETLEWHSMTETRLENPNARMPSTSKQVDLTTHETQSLTAYVGSLPAPVQLNGTSLTQSEAALEGQRLFDKVGCADCHVKDVGPANGIYSDLLLHDMGSALADAVSPVPELDDSSTPFSGGYSGGFVPDQLVKIATKINQEWRTPPLWGVRDSSPYLHDGRAVNLDDAIRMHSGEAAASARKYRSLGMLDRDRVIAFLSTLAPKGAKPRAVFFPNKGRGGPGGFGGSGSGSGGFFSIGGSTNDATPLRAPFEFINGPPNKQPPNKRPTE
ncbi:MAG: di-heme oxidoredictase family protein [Planctomycetales bacterium]